MNVYMGDIWFLLCIFFCPPISMFDMLCSSSWQLQETRCEDGERTHHECLVLGPWVGVKRLEDGVVVCQRPNARCALQRRLLFHFFFLFEGVSLVLYLYVAE